MSVNNKYYKSDVTSKIINCAHIVQNTLGSGFQELIYQRALKIELDKAGLDYEREKEMTVHYQNHDIGLRRVDFLIDNDIMVELKAVTKLEQVHYAQTMNYIETYKVKIGLLINFGNQRLEVKRFIK
jgi:GxxExxY protein